MDLVGIFMWWTCHHQVSVILTIFMLLVWYSPFWSILIQFPLIQFILISFLSGLHSMFMFWYGLGLLFQECWLVSSFSYCVFSQCFLRYKVLFCFQWICGFPSFVWHSWMIMVWIDHSVVVYTENVYIEGYIHQHLNTILLFVPTFQYPFIIIL